MHSLVGAERGIEFYSCFISYSTKDDEFATRLHGRMRDARLRVWFASEDIQGGKKLHEQIETAIRVYDKLLIVLSEASLESEWVMTELRNARKAERQSGRRKLFPVRLVDYETLRNWECFDADSGKDLAVNYESISSPTSQTGKITIRSRRPSNVKKNPKKENRK
jgi:TIR domain